MAKTSRRDWTSRKALQVLQNPEEESDWSQTVPPLLPAQLSIQVYKSKVSSLQKHGKDSQKSLPCTTYTEQDRDKDWTNSAEITYTKTEKHVVTAFSLLRIDQWFTPDSPLHAVIISASLHTTISAFFSLLPGTRY